MSWVSQWVVMHFRPTSKDKTSHMVFISCVLVFADYISLIDIFNDVFRRGYCQLPSMRRRHENHCKRVCLTFGQYFR